MAMGDSSSGSNPGGSMQLDSYYGGGGGGGGARGRAFSRHPYAINGFDPKIKKGGSVKTWGFNDPEFQRKKRVAGYKVYAMEGRVKGSFRQSIRWIKNKWARAVYGWW